MILRGPVLCATDLSETADAALRQAFVIASEITAPFVVCHVLPEAFNVRVLFPQNAGIDAPFQSELERRAVEALRNRMDAVIGSESRSIPIEIETGTAHAGILTAADRLGAGLLVVGPGVTAQRVARSAHSPVLVARPSPTGGGVLAATDLSDPSLPAVQTGATEAIRRGVRFRVVYCFDVSAPPYLETTRLPTSIVFPLPRPIIEELEATAREQLAAALGSLNVVSEGFVLRRPAASGIIEAARAIATALIVVGTRGRTGLARLALGSVAETVIAQAPCSVLVVPLHGVPDCT